MPTYQLVRDGKEPKIIGDFPNLEAVHKLTIFKQHPELKQCIVEIMAVAKAAKRSNRWRVIWSDFSIDWFSNLTDAEALEIYTEHAPNAEKLIKVPKYAYHINDGPIDN